MPAPITAIFSFVMPVQFPHQSEHTKLMTSLFHSVSSRCIHLLVSPELQIAQLFFEASILILCVQISTHQIFWLRPLHGPFSKESFSCCTLPCLFPQLLCFSKPPPRFSFASDVKRSKEANVPTRNFRLVWRIREISSQEPLLPLSVNYPPAANYHVGQKLSSLRFTESLL